MRLFTVTPVTAALAAVLALGGCTSGEAVGPAVGDGSNIALSVAPLQLTGVGDATYRVVVVNGATPTPETVFDVTLTSSRYGDGAGALTYVGPCDASANPNVVTLELLELRDDADAVIPETAYRRPPAVSQALDCRPNADVAVTFDLTILRSGEQGFFDVAVEFSDIFCSAKLDCLDAFLHNGDTRDTTVVVAWACASGTGEQTWLYMNPVVVTCDDGTQLTVAPGAAPGNQGGLAPYFFQAAVYRGREDLPGVDKCYWNTAIGVDEAALVAGLNCAVTASTTAGDAQWPQGKTPPNSVYPYIGWNVPIVTNGALACGQHAIDVPGSGVATAYTDAETGARFTFAMACDEDADVTEVVANGVACATAVGQGETVEFTPLGGDRIAVNVSGTLSTSMRLPAGLALATECCQDLCCMP